MSGGHFDYNQSKIKDIIESIEDYVYGRPLDEEDVEYFKRDSWLSKWNPEKLEYIIKNQHTKPNECEYSPQTISEFLTGLYYLRRAYVYAQRIDWLLSDDDGEEEFHHRLQEDLEEIKEEELKRKFDESKI